MLSNIQGGESPTYCVSLRCQCWRNGAVGDGKSLLVTIGCSVYTYLLGAAESMRRAFAFDSLHVMFPYRLHRGKVPPEVLLRPRKSIRLFVSFNGVNRYEDQLDRYVQHESQRTDGLDHTSGVRHSKELSGACGQSVLTE